MNSITSNRYLISTLLAMTLITTSACNSKRLRQIGTIVAVGIAAKLIYDMVVDYQSKQVNDEAQVATRYKKLHGHLPPQPLLVDYESSIKPGDVVSAGTDISIQSRLEVVRGESTRQVNIQEKIIIFDNEDPTKELKSLTKVVNEKTKTSGAFVNEFTFKLPKGMPQGIYPVRTQVIVNGQAYEAVHSQMQLVKIQSNVQSLVASF
ncbi:MAG: hypothetical protein Q9M92_05705 [Enterobacterales bacterium]|nr:hypothetical protein [Enterobacterales bacterium]